MSTYYPSQAASAYGAQPQMMYQQQPSYVQTASYGMPQSSYGVPATGVVYVPSSRSRSYSMRSGYYNGYDDDRYSRRRYGHRPRSRRNGHRSYERSYSYPTSSYPYYSGVPMSQPTVMMQQPTAYSYAQPGYYGQPKWTLSQRIRLFFGLAPTPAFKYRSEKNTWGFMGYSRRQRYIDPRTGQEVDRDGRPVLRV